VAASLGVPRLYHLQRSNCQHYAMEMSCGQAISAEALLLAQTLQVRVPKMMKMKKKKNLAHHPSVKPNRLGRGLEPGRLDVDSTLIGARLNRWRILGRSSLQSNVGVAGACRSCSSKVARMAPLLWAKSTADSP
jgi:hypothetical protein